MLNTGIRISTALDLRWEDIDWHNGIIYFRNIKVNGNVFTFPMTQVLKEVLTELGINREAKVFPFKGENSVRFFTRVQKKIGIKKPYGIHKIKHTFVSELINMGKSLSDVSELSNTSESTLKKYYTLFDKSRIMKEIDGVEI